MDAMWSWPYTPLCGVHKDHLVCPWEVTLARVLSCHVVFYICQTYEYLRINKMVLESDFSIKKSPLLQSLDPIQ